MRASVGWVATWCDCPAACRISAYTLAVSGPMCDAPLAEASLSVIAPERSWVVPDDPCIPPTPSSQRKLNLQATTSRPSPSESEIQPGESVKVTLAWQALDEMEESYHVFVHLRDEAGRVIAQNDGVPAGWTRPTTGWAPGEVVMEERQIALPREMAPGAYTLHVGWYLPEGLRLPTQDEEDGVVLATIQIAD